MKRLRLGAVLHFLIAIGHVGCLFALDEAFEAYGIREIMHQMVSGHVWMLYALTIGLVLAFCLVGLYALSFHFSTRMEFSSNSLPPSSSLFHPLSAKMSS